MPLQNWNDLFNLPTTLSDFRPSKSEDDSDLKHNKMTNSFNVAHPFWVKTSLQVPRENKNFHRKVLKDTSGFHV